MWIGNVTDPRLTNNVKPHRMTHWAPLGNANPLMDQPMKTQLADGLTEIGPRADTVALPTGTHMKLLL